MYTVQPFAYHGTIRAAGSKSYLQRAIAIAALLEKPVEILGYYPSNDVLAAIKICEALGADINIEGAKLFIKGGLPDTEKTTINCGESGLSSRMFSPIAAILSDEVTINGEGSLLSRPMDMITEALEKLGAEVDSNSGRLPLKIKGRLHAGEIHIDASESSQLLTGLLIALSFVEGETVIHVSGLNSKPYIDMTIETLRAFDIRVSHDNYKVFYIVGKMGHHADKYTYEIEGDWSGAAFHVVGAAISGRIDLAGLKADSVQADRAILDVAALAGANVLIENNLISIEKGALSAFEFDATDCPDLFPPLAALAACCKGTTRITGIDRLHHKESDRGITIQEEMAKLGIKIELIENTMVINGGSIKGGTISSRNDHRIAMMGAILATASTGPIHIQDPDAVNKSYPDFYNDLPK